MQPPALILHHASDPMALTIHSKSEKQMIEGCLRKDNTSQRQLYERFSGKMLSVCRRYVKDSMAAEDVLVTAFTNIFKCIGQFRFEGSFEGWIRKIVVNESLTYLRKNQSVYLETDIEVAAGKPDYQQLENELEVEDLMTIIQALPPGYRMVFNMYALDGYSHKEIGESLGISEGTSKSQLNRARAFLQKELIKLGSYQERIKKEL